MLSQEQREVIQLGIVEKNFEASAWIDFLQNLLSQYQAHIQWQDSMSKKANRLFWLSFFLSLGILGWVIGWFLALLIGLVVGYFLRKYVKGKTAIYRILPNTHFVELTQNYFLPLFKFLAQETQEKISAKLNFQPESECRIGNRFYQVGNYDIMENTYLRPIVSLKAVFTDRTQIFIGVSQKVVIKNKKNRFRTRKLKSKTKKTTIYNIKAIFHSKKYKASNTSQSLKLESKSKQPDFHYGLEPLLTRIAELYAQVQPR